MQGVGSGSFIFFSFSFPAVWVGGMVRGRGRGPWCRIDTCREGTGRDGLGWNCEFAGVAFACVCVCMCLCFVVLFSVALYSVVQERVSI